MPVTAAAMEAWCRTLLGGDRAYSHRPLNEFLAAIPRLESLADVPAGTAVLVRGDVDCKPGTKVGEGDIRLRSMRETLQYGRQRGWKQIVFGHVGRKPEGSLDKVSQRLGEILQTTVQLIPDWLDEAGPTILDQAAAAVHRAAPGAILILENTRKYAIERSLWEAGPDDAAKLAAPLARLANEFSQKLAKVYVNEALSAGSLDASTTIVPAAMQRVALGRYVAGQFDGPMQRCLAATLVVFSGLKADKLDDLQAVVQRGAARFVIVAGNLAMALKKAQAQLEGRQFCIGAAENTQFAKEPYYISPKRVAQAEEILKVGQSKGMRFALPCDFVLKDGQVAETLRPADQQFDVGPASSELFSKTIGDYLDELRQNPALSKVAFYNGVFGMFEDVKFQAGTRKFVGELKRMKDAGVEVYVGGGEGGKAVEDFGQPDWITHCFTAGGTVLNALGSEPVPYLLALKMAVERRAEA